MNPNGETCYQIEWTSLDGREFTEYFVTPFVRAKNWDIETSYVHTCANPEASLRKYLQHIPLVNVEISIYWD